MESVRMIAVMTLFSAVSALGLAAFSNHAMPIIKETERFQMVDKQLKKVITNLEEPDPCKPSEAGFDNNPAKDSVCINGREVFRCKKGDTTVGYALSAVGEKAYSGTLTCLVGLSPEGKVLGFEIVQHAETPGLGSEITDCKWRKQLVGKGPQDMKWSVRKDGGDVDAISGATISSRSVLNCIADAREFVMSSKEKIENSTPSTEECNAK